MPSIIRWLLAPLHIRDVCQCVHADGKCTRKAVWRGTEYVPLCVECVREWEEHNENPAGCLILDVPHA